jgi:hypothetical protein
MNPSQESLQAKLRTSMQIGFLIARSYATTIEIFLHKGFGRRYFGLNAIVGAFILFACSLLLEEWDTTWLKMYLLFYVMYLFIHLLVPDRDRGQHSYYAGYPLLLPQRSRVSEYAFKRYYEPLFVAMFGGLVWFFNAPLGGYLIGAGWALNVVNSMGRVADRNRVLDLRDAVIEQQIVSEEFRSTYR